MLNEADTRAKLIDPKFHPVGWGEDRITREHYFQRDRGLYERSYYSRGGCQIHHPLPTALAQYPLARPLAGMLGEEAIVELQTLHFPDPQAGPQHQQDQRPVAWPRDHGQEPMDLLVGQIPGQRLGLTQVVASGVDWIGQVGLAVVVSAIGQELEPHAKRDQSPIDRCPRPAQRLLPDDEPVDVCALSLT